jgi:hypothetical protein
MATRSNRITVADDGNTCAVGDPELDASATKVRFRRDLLDPECEEPAHKRREAQASTTAAART